MKLHESPCTPPTEGTPPLSAEELQDLIAELTDWVMEQDSKLVKTWRFADFASALAWLNRAAAICEQCQHHAEFELGWGRVQATIWTHSIGGLSKADFVLAARIDQQ